MKPFSHSSTQSYPGISSTGQSQRLRVLSEVVSHQPQAIEQTTEVLVTEAEGPPFMGVTWTSDRPIDWGQLGDIVWVADPEREKLEEPDCSYAEAFGDPEASLLSPATWKPQEDGKRHSDTADANIPIVFPNDSLHSEEGSIWNRHEHTEHRHKEPPNHPEAGDVSDKEGSVAPEDTATSMIPSYPTEDLPIIFPGDPLYPKKDLAERSNKKLLHFPDEGSSSEGDVDLVGTPFDVDFIDLIDIR